MYRYLAALLLFISLCCYGSAVYLDKNQVADPASWSAYSIEDLILSRNSVFGRYGYVFKSSALNRHFMSLGWYSPDRKFSYDRLSGIDRKNVNAILAAEQKKVAEFKSRLARLQTKTKRYFMTVRSRERIPAATENEIRKWWKEKVADFLYPQISVPVLLSADCSDEKDAAFIGGRLKYRGARFSYWEARYDDAGRLRVLKNCSCEEGWPDSCDDVYYFDKKGNLLMVRGSLRGTTVSYEYYYQYCLGSVVWIEVTLMNGSAGVPDVTGKFFY